MKIVIDIPNDEIPKKQEYMEIGLHFIDGTVCECTYPFSVLPKGHGELIDKDAVLDMMNHGILEEYITTMGGVIPADR